MERTKSQRARNSLHFMHAVTFAGGIIRLTGEEKMRKDAVCYRELETDEIETRTEIVTSHK
jgi:hypothetical protein